MKTLATLCMILIVSFSSAEEKEYCIFSGNANASLAKEVVSCLNTDLNQATVSRYNDGEINIQILEDVQNKDVFVIQSTFSNEKGSVNDHMLELYLMVRALKRASAKSVTAVIPYYGYARQDRKADLRVPISAAEMAMLLENGGVDKVIAVDLHCGQIEGFFRNAAVENLSPSQTFADYIVQLNLKDPVVVSPDAGAVKRAKKFKERLESKGMAPSFAIIIKQRAGAGVIGSTDLVGDVAGKDVIIMDDICDTGGTIVAAAAELKNFGARHVYACITHPIFSNSAVDKIADSSFKEMIVTNSVTISEELPDNIKQISIAPLLAEVILQSIEY